MLQVYFACSLYKKLYLRTFMLIDYFKTREHTSVENTYWFQMIKGPYMACLFKTF